MIRPAVVVLFWAGLNAALTFGLWLYDENPLFVGLYASGVFFTLVFAAAVFLGRRDCPDEKPRRLPATSRSGVFLALAVALTGLGFIYGPWFFVLAVVSVITGVVLLRGERLPSGVATSPTEVPTVEFRRSRERGPVARGVKAATVSVLAARAVAAVRRWRKRVRS